MGSRADVLSAEGIFFGALVRAQTDELESLLTGDFSLADLSGGSHVKGRAYKRRPFGRSRGSASRGIIPA